MHRRLFHAAAPRDHQIMLGAEYIELRSVIAVTETNTIPLSEVLVQRMYSPDPHELIGGCVN